MTASHLPHPRCSPPARHLGRTRSAAATLAVGMALLSIATPASADAGKPGTLTGIFEPSGLKQLPDGRILVIEDEAEHAFALLTLPSGGGAPVTDAQVNQRLRDSFERRMNDLEGVAMDGEGWLYAITSHSSNKKGERKADREQLVRFKLSGDRAVEQRYHDALREQLGGSDKLKRLIRTRGASTPDLGMIDIEGLAFDRKNGRLMLGLSKPLFDGKALIVTIANPDEMFERQAEPDFAETYLLDLKGSGIRGIEYDAAHAQYLLVNEVENADGKNRSRLWRWRGDAGSAPEAITPPGFAQMKNVEAVGVIGGGKDGQATEYLFLSDEGSIRKQRHAQFLRLPADQPSR